MNTINYERMNLALISNHIVEVAHECENNLQYIKQSLKIEFCRLKTLNINLDTTSLKNDIKSGFELIRNHAVYRFYTLDEKLTR